MSWYLQELVRNNKCMFAVIFEGERLLNVGCRTTCVRKNVVGRGTARAQNTDVDRYNCAVCRFPGAVAGSSGNTAKPVLDPAVCPAPVTESVWTEPTEPESVTATTVSMEQPVRPARVASMVSTAIRVGCSCLHQTATGRPPVHADSVGTDCACNNGRCSDGINGDGTCECDVGWRGILCDESMTSHHPKSDRVNSDPARRGRWNSTPSLMSCRNRITGSSVWFHQMSHQCQVSA